MKAVSLNRLKSSFDRLMKRLEIYAQRARTRRQLFELKDYALKDLGLTRQQALEEAQLPFWKGDNARLAEDEPIQVETEANPMPNS